jgi:hypothetical protein
MPSPVPLPRTYRPFGARLAAAAAGVALVAATAVLWLLLASDVKAAFTPVQRLTVLLFIAAILAALYAVARSALIADVTGVTVVNGYRTRRLEWAELVRVSLTTHRPWALLDLADGSTVSVMAIQSADGQRATAAARELAALLTERTRIDRDD